MWTRSRGRTILGSALAAIVAIASFGLLSSGVFASSTIDESIVRVHLSSYGTPLSLTIKATGSHIVEDNGKSISGTFTVEPSGTNIVVKAAGETWTLDGDILIAAGSSSTDNLLQINGGYSFAGDMRIIVKGAGLKLVNHVNINTYTAGVIAYEMSNSWPLEALKAQAIAARSYAYYQLKNVNRTTTEQDFVNGESAQVYLGWNSSYTNCIKAVEDTKNMILQTAAGSPLFACFSASNGGYTEYPKSSGAAATNFDYLPYKEDPYDIAFALTSGTYSGSVTIPKTFSASDLKTSTAQPYKFLREKLVEQGVNVSALTGNVVVRSITLTNPRYTSPDRAYLGARIVLGLSSGDVTLDFAPYTPSGSTSKYPFLSGILNLGTKFSMLYLREDAGDGTTTAQSGVVNAAAGLNVREGPATSYKVLTALVNGTSVSIVGESGDWYQISYNGGTAYVNKAYITITATTSTSGSYKIASVRYGHAAGLSQVGAYQMARESKTYIDILTFYYNLGTASKLVTMAWDEQTSSGNSGDAGATTTTTPATPTTQTGKVVSAAGLNVREGAGTSYKVLGVLSNGASVTITGTSGDWYQISYSGKTGYVSKTYVSITSTGTTDSASSSSSTSSSSSSSSSSATSGSSSTTASGSTSTTTTTTTQTTQTGTVKVPSTTVLNVRAGAGTSYKILGTLKNGTAVTITGTSGDWYKISYAGTTAYVSKTYVSVGTASATKTGTVKVPSTTVLNVRAGAGTSYKVLGTLKNGTAVTITGESGSWWKISYNGAAAYVSKTYISA